MGSRSGNSLPQFPAQVPPSPNSSTPPLYGTMSNSKNATIESEANSGKIHSNINNNSSSSSNNGNHHNISIQSNSSLMSFFSSSVSSSSSSAAANLQKFFSLSAEIILRDTPYRAIMSVEDRILTLILINQTTGERWGCNESEESEADLSRERERVCVCVCVAYYKTKIILKI